jgi:4-amino-4-deoxy-L-arabinose transferase
MISQVQIICLISSCIFLTAAIISFIYSKEKLIYLFLFLAAFSAFCFAALLDPFLNLWDERYHALVAKNLASHPLIPTLYEDPVLQQNYSGWYNSIIWIHKQPLFLWQIALSYKLFGSSELAVRLPSIILGSFLVLITFRTGSLLVNRNTGFFAAVFLISSFYLSELINGRQCLDHNDVAFLAYISFSIWSLVEYRYSGQKKWIILTGIFSGMAILCKWLVGLLVYLGWFAFKILGKNFKVSGYKDILFSLLITALVALPWQIYTFIRFPLEATLAHDYNARHFLEALEGHTGEFWYHFQIINAHYGPYTFILIIPAFIAFYLRIKNKKNFFSIMTMIAATYLFFTVAKTKMPSFTFIAAMMIFIALGSLTDWIRETLSKSFTNKWAGHAIFLLMIGILVFVRFDYNRYQKVHLDSIENQYSSAMKHNKQVFTSLDLPENAVLLNVSGTHFIEAMYYTGLPSYNYIPTEMQYVDLKKKGKVAAVFMPESILPDYMVNDPGLIVINAKVIEE